MRFYPFASKANFCSTTPALPSVAKEYGSLIRQYAFWKSDITLNMLAQTLSKNFEHQPLAKILQQRIEFRDRLYGELGDGQYTSGPAVFHD
jgi:hypothetical protein